MWAKPTTPDDTCSFEQFVQGVTMTEWSEARLKYVWSKEGQVLRGLIPVKHPPFGGGGS